MDIKLCKFCEAPATTTTAASWSVCAKCLPPSKPNSIAVIFTELKAVPCSWCDQGLPLDILNRPYGFVGIHEWTGTACPQCYNHFTDEAADDATDNSHALDLAARSPDAVITRGITKEDDE